MIIIIDRDKSRVIRGLGQKVARFLLDKLDKIIMAYILWLSSWEEILYKVIKIPGPLKELRLYI